MSEEAEVAEVQQEAPSVDLSQLMAENNAMKAKMEELLTEAKRAKQAKREIEAETQAERERIAREKGDYEQLHKSAQEKYETTLSELDSLRQGIANEKRNNTAMKLAADLADGANAELLSEFIGRRLKFHEDGVKVTDVNGNLTVSSFDDLKSEFEALNPAKRMEFVKSGGTITDN